MISRIPIGMLIRFAKTLVMTLAALAMLQAMAVARSQGDAGSSDGEGAGDQPEDPKGESLDLTSTAAMSLGGLKSGLRKIHDEKDLEAGKRYYFDVIVNAWINQVTVEHYMISPHAIPPQEPKKEKISGEDSAGSTQSTFTDGALRIAKKVGGDWDTAHYVIGADGTKQLPDAKQIKGSQEVSTSAAAMIRALIRARVLDERLSGPFGGAFWEGRRVRFYLVIDPSDSSKTRIYWFFPDAGAKADEEKPQGRGRSDGFESDAALASLLLDASAQDVDVVAGRQYVQAKTSSPAEEPSRVPVLKNDYRPIAAIFDARSRETLAALCPWMFEWGVLAEPPVVPVEHAHPNRAREIDLALEMLATAYPDVRNTRVIFEIAPDGTGSVSGLPGEPDGYQRLCINLVLRLYTEEYEIPNSAYGTKACPQGLSPMDAVRIIKILRPEQSGKDTPSDDDPPATPPEPAPGNRSDSPKQGVFGARSIDPLDFFASGASDIAVDAVELRGSADLAAAPLAHELAGHGVLASSLVAPGAGASTAAQSSGVQLARAGTAIASATSSASKVASEVEAILRESSYAGSRRP